MALITEQLQALRALKDHIDASADLNIYPNTPDGNYEVAALLNLKAAPDFTVWKSSVPKNEVGKAFQASALDAITAGNNDKLNNFAAWNEFVYPSRVDQRAGSPRASRLVRFQQYANGELGISQ